MGLYIHVPFCNSKCPYCAFVSSTDTRKVDRYERSICQEIEMIRSRWNGQPETIYVGGGTPSVLSPQFFERIFPLLGAWGEVEEWTVEANPESLTASLLDVWKNLGVNRVSIGVQSLDDRLLRRLGRGHNRQKALRAVELAIKKGFRVSADLMFGLPEGSARQFVEDCRQLIRLGVRHLSLYQLTIEDRSFWGTHPPKLTDGEAPYRWAQSVLPRIGLEQYEVASFAERGQESRHNTKYWLLENVIGIGPAAWGYWNGWRTENHSSFEIWEAYLRSGRLPLRSLHRRSLAGRAGERFILGTRRCEGIDIVDFIEKEGENAWVDLLSKVDQWPLSCYRLSRSRLELTRKGMRLANSLWCDCLELGDENG